MRTPAPRPRGMLPQVRPWHQCPSCLCVSCVSGHSCNTLGTRDFNPLSGWGHKWALSQTTRVSVLLCLCVAALWSGSMSLLLSLSYCVSWSFLSLLPPLSPVTQWVDPSTGSGAVDHELALVGEMAAGPRAPTQGSVSAPVSLCLVSVSLLLPGTHSKGLPLCRVNQGRLLGGGRAGAPQVPGTWVGVRARSGAPLHGLSCPLP